MSHPLKTVRRLLFSALFAAPLLVSTPAFAQEEEEDDTEEVEEADTIETDDAVTITVDGGYADTDPSAVTVYNTELQPYGVWVNDPRWGTIWVPNASEVGADFAPYSTAGHWELTADDEWLWVSDYAWGYIPFHYGRWVYVSGTGWGWIPGRAYAPSWVVWRTGASGYIGWAPMPPAYYWVGSSYYTCSPPVAAYVFVSTTYVYDRSVSSHVYRDRADVERAANGTSQHQPSKPSYKPSGPSQKDANVTPPTKRGAPDSKSMALARRTGMSGGSTPTATPAPTKKATSGTSGSSSPTRGSKPASKPKVTSVPATTTSTPRTSKRASSPNVVSSPKVVSTPKVVTSTPKTSSTPKVVTSTPKVSTPKAVRSTPKVVTSTPRRSTTSTPRTSTPRTSSPRPTSAPRVSTPKASSSPAPARRISPPAMRGGGRRR